MPTFTVSDYLKYANLQMAAEAFLVYADGSTKTGTDFSRALLVGNNHATRLTPTQANDFEAHWVVLDQCANTPSGFSGTLFQCYQDDPATGAKAGDIVVSFRSTEAVDDAVRDAKATDELEVSAHGFAFGQISDMEAWFKSLQTKPGVADQLVGKQIAVTGYSLGGHPEEHHRSTESTHEEVL